MWICLCMCMCMCMCMCIVHCACVCVCVCVWTWIFTHMSVICLCPNIFAFLSLSLSLWLSLTLSLSLYIYIYIHMSRESKHTQHKPSWTSKDVHTWVCTHQHIPAHIKYTNQYTYQCKWVHMAAQKQQQRKHNQKIKENHQFKNNTIMHTNQACVHGLSCFVVLSMHSMGFCLCFEEVTISED